MYSARSTIMASGFWLCIAALTLVFLWHISVGAKPLPISTVIDALFFPKEDMFDHIIVRELRMPRALFAVSVGAALSVSGAIMQGITRNPLAEPSILGLMAGATFSVVIGIGWLELAGTVYVPLFAAMGALIGALLVWGISNSAPGGATPLTLILSGVAVSGFLYAIQSAAILTNQEAFGNFRVWLSGSLAGREMSTFMWALPWLIAGLSAAFVIARQITALSMGEETAAGLGVNTKKIKTIGLVAVIALTASAVSISGPLGFVGLVIPHVVRLFVGSDYRLIIPFSAIIGAVYLVLVDIAARLILAPLEISTGIVTTFLGAPVFIWLVRAKL
ncbi:iron ABC transporter permease [Vibrio cyclitrophicus]|nr:iron ABC transporter permease [Vibrio cyclitrophicus]UPR53137.1 iron ABC transporter permease [Vibrio cyclitrophicus]